MTHLGATEPDSDPALQRVIVESRAQLKRNLFLGESARDLAAAFTLLALAAALPFLFTSPRPFDLALAVALTAALAVAARVEFRVGSGVAVPTQLVFVPMLLLLPTPYVPLIVAAANVVASTTHVVRGEVAPSRLLLSPADATFALGPAFVLVVAGAELPAWEHLPIYVIALVAQLVGEFLSYVLRAQLFHAMAPREVLAELRFAHRVDILLFPVGVLAALAAADEPEGALLVMALIPLLRFFEAEREGRIQHSLELGRAYRGTALLLRDLLEEDDEYTGHHTEDVVELTASVAQAMGVDEDTQREAEMGALLHDIGKIAVPDEIINKPGPLNDEEWAIMKTHTVEGERMLQQVGGLLSSVGVVVRASHERWDGRGYPDGLVGAAIPVAARIISACDAFNAMTTDRSYRKALPLEVAIDELHKNAGTQFAPEVVEALVAVVTRDVPDWQLSLAETPSGVEAKPQPVKQA